MSHHSSSAIRVGLSLGLLVIIALAVGGVPPSLVQAQSPKLKARHPLIFQTRFISRTVSTQRTS
jgi:hypothetical protein